MDKVTRVELLIEYANEPKMFALIEAMTDAQIGQVNKAAQAAVGSYLRGLQMRKSIISDSEKSATTPGLEGSEE